MTHNLKSNDFSLKLKTGTRKVRTHEFNADILFVHKHAVISEIKVLSLKINIPAYIHTLDKLTSYIEGTQKSIKSNVRKIVDSAIKDAFRQSLSGNDNKKKLFNMNDLNYSVHLNYSERTLIVIVNSVDDIIKGPSRIVGNRLMHNRLIKPGNRNAIMYAKIRTGKVMGNIGNEFTHGRFYRKKDLKKMKRHPIARVPITSRQIKKYYAFVPAMNYYENLNNSNNNNNNNNDNNNNNNNNNSNNNNNNSNNNNNTNKNTNANTRRHRKYEQRKSKKTRNIIRRTLRTDRRGPRNNNE